MESKELGMYQRPFVRSWRQTHFPEKEFAHLIATRTPAQIAKYMLHYARTGKKSWVGQIKYGADYLARADGLETNELETENGLLVVAKRPDQEGKIVVLRRKE
jgi:hypothetical protein